MKIIEKLKKLIAHEESARAIGNTAEAQAFAERIQNLLNSHNLSMSEVELHTIESSPVGIEPVQEDFSVIENWQRMLLREIAEANGCYPLESEKGFQVVVGRQQDREIVVSLFRYFEKLGQEMADKFERDIWNYSQQPSFFYGRSTAFYPMFDKSDKTKSRISFLLGFVAALCERLRELKAADEFVANESSALIYLGNRRNDNQKWINDYLNVTPQEIECDEVDQRALMRGANAGNTVALTDKSLGNY